MLTPDPEFRLDPSPQQLATLHAAVVRPEIRRDQGSREAPPFYPLDTRNLPCLVDLTSELAFFTPAVLCSQGLSSAYLSDFLRERPTTFWSLLLDREIFAGLEINTDTRWNRALFALPQEDWEMFLNFVAGLQWWHPQLNQRWSCGLQDLEIPDPVQPELGSLPLVALGLRQAASKLCLNWWDYPRQPRLWRLQEKHRERSGN